MKINQLSTDALSLTVVNTMLAESNVLQQAEFYSIVGNADYTRKSASASGGTFRALNNDYQDNQVDPSFANPALKIFGDKVQVDRAHERRGSDIPSVRASELLSFAKNLGKEFQNNFINGDAALDVKKFNGLKKIMPAGQKITASANGFSVPLGNSDANKTAQQQFIELVNQALDRVDGGAQCLLMDGKALDRLTSIAPVTWAVNEFGTRIAFFNNVPVLVSGYDKAGNRIIPHTEAVGGSGNVCTSIYGFRFGEKSDLSFATNIGVEVKDLGLVGVHYTHSVDFDLDLVLLNDKSVARLEGIIIA